MLNFMNSKLVKKRFAYAAMSFLIVWHVIAMAVAPAPDSQIKRSVGVWFNPYLTLLGLDNEWGFFAPDIPASFEFRYVVEDAVGKRHEFDARDQWSSLQPTFIWFMDHYKTVMESVDELGEIAVAALCKEHASLNPVSVTLIDVQQKEFTPEDRLNGKSPLDPEFIELEPLEPVRCPGK